jgi:hypothetical protein
MMHAQHLIEPSVSALFVRGKKLGQPVTALYESNILSQELNGDISFQKLRKSAVNKWI